MDTAQWPQGIGDEVKGAVSEKKARPQKEQALNCPRCNSTNTKFCYYNNYSLSQPRYYCKTCRRYWTQGGSLRNIPVGGASRRNKKQSSSSSSPAISASRKVPTTDLISSSPLNFSAPNPKFQQGQDLNLAYNPFGNLPALPIFGTKSFNPNLPIMELFKNGDHMGSSASYMVAGSGSDPGFGSGFRVHDDEDRYKAGLGNFPSDQNGYDGNLQGDDHANNNSDIPSSSSSRMLFPFEELKGVSNNEQFDHHQDWNGMLAGGSW